MLDHFLTSALEIVIVLDIIGIAAYFILGGLRSKEPKTAGNASWWQRLLPGRPANATNAPPIEEASQSFSRVLYGFQNGLS